MDAKDDTGNTILSSTIEEFTEDKLDITGYLLQRGANPNSEDLNGHTPLYKAINKHGITFSTYRKLLLLLLDKKADLSKHVSK